MWFNKNAEGIFAFRIPGRRSMKKIRLWRSTEALYGLTFYFVDLKNRDEFRNGQQVTDSFGCIKQLKLAASSSHSGITANDLTQSTAVHIRDICQVQEKFGLLALDQLIDLALQLDVALTQKNLAIDVEDNDIAALSLRYRHTGSPNVFEF